MGQQKNTSLKAYVRFDGTGRIVPSSLILQRFKPKDGNWKQINATECCGYVPSPSTTTTTTTVAPTTTTTSTSTSTTTSTSTSTSTTTTTTTEAPTTTTTTTTIGGPYYYNVDAYNYGTGCSLIGNTNVVSDIPAIIGKYYDSPGISPTGAILVLSVAGSGSIDATSYFSNVPRDTCAP
jgi:hypothetical protein